MGAMTKKKVQALRFLSSLDSGSYLDQGVSREPQINLHILLLHQFRIPQALKDIRNLSISFFFPFHSFTDRGLRFPDGDHKELFQFPVRDGGGGLHRPELQRPRPQQVLPDRRRHRQAVGGELPEAEETRRRSVVSMCLFFFFPAIFGFS
ncbi:unnamed protein product [Cuscuta campestris]|uniref:Uncharacterized protein n=1 Tax=Cuscuta campestris TaxID=132261 RepID=A0A484MIK2_9ASTE|nr:unnamed protein product [Cuscuta campestris]